MFIDTTLFNNEFDMLDIRLELSQHYVDQWIICEGNRTMSGKPKPYHLTENIARYEKWGDRIHVVQLNIPESWSNWDIENGQRAAILEAYKDLADDTVVMHSDLDEILNPELVPELLAQLEQSTQPITCTLEMYIYKFDQKLDRKWAGNVIAKKHMFKDPCTLYKGPDAGVGHAQKKKDRTLCEKFPKNAGWHWGWMGSDELIKTKAQSCIETQHRDVDQMVESFRKLDAGSAINHKCVTRQVTPEYPDTVMNVIKQYPYWT